MLKEVLKALHCIALRAELLQDFHPADLRMVRRQWMFYFCSRVKAAFKSKWRVALHNELKQVSVPFTLVCQCHNLEVWEEWLISRVYWWSNRTLKIKVQKPMTNISFAANEMRLVKLNLTWCTSWRLRARSWKSLCLNGISVLSLDAQTDVFQLLVLHIDVSRSILQLTDLRHNPHLTKFWKTQ